MKQARLTIKTAKQPRIAQARHGTSHRKKREADKSNDKDRETGANSADTEEFQWCIPLRNSSGAYLLGIPVVPASEAFQWYLPLRTSSGAYLLGIPVVQTRLSIKTAKQPRIAQNQLGTLHPHEREADKANDQDRETPANSADTAWNITHTKA